jgi:hypothetical protein
LFLEKLYLFCLVISLYYSGAILIVSNKTLYRSLEFKLQIRVVIGSSYIRMFIAIYKGRFPKAVRIFEKSQNDSLALYGLKDVDPNKISSNNMLEHISKEICSRTRSIGIFPHNDSYTRPVRVYQIVFCNSKV